MSRRRRQAKRQIVDDPIYGLKISFKIYKCIDDWWKKNDCRKNFL